MSWNPTVLSGSVSLDVLVTIANGWAALCVIRPVTMSSTQLWEHFCVVGLSQTLVTVQGEQGWFGSEQKYKPHLIDSLLHNGSSRVPPELPTVSSIVHKAVRKATIPCVIGISIK